MNPRDLSGHGTGINPPPDACRLDSAAEPDTAADGQGGLPCPDSTTPRAWLEELTARYGPSVIDPGPYVFPGHQRECWAWRIAGHTTATLSLDGYRDHALIAARLGITTAEVRQRIGAPFRDSQVRSVLVAVGLLDPAPDSKQQEG